MRVVRQLMGFPVSLDLRDRMPEAELTAAAEAAFASLERAELVFSPFRADSELSRFGRGELALDSASPELGAVLALAEGFRAASGGVFDVRRGPAGARILDANGIVKGWAAERAAGVLESAGLARFCLNAGGDVVVRGAPEPGDAASRWQIGVASPWSARTVVGVVALGGTPGAPRAIASSGLYARGAHIVDGRVDAASAPPSFDYAGVSVLHAGLTTADVLATTVFAMGRGGPEWAAAAYGAGVVTIDHAGLVATAGAVPWASSAA